MPSVASVAFCAVVVILFTVMPVGRVVHARTAVNEPFAFRVDEIKRARASYATMPVMPSILGFFEVFESYENGARKRLLNGPWHTGTLPGRLSRDSDNQYTVYAKDAATGAYFRIIFKRASEDELLVNFEVQMPAGKVKPGIEFEICSLSGEFFKGADVQGVPAIAGNAGTLPVEPRPLRDRFLYNGKNEITVKGKLCDIRIRDLSGDQSINVADFRNTPWDRKKSFYIYCGKTGLLPGKDYRFSYSIQVTPPSLSPARVAAPHGITPEAVRILSNSNVVLTVEPKEYVAASGLHQLTQGEDVFAKTQGTAQAMLVAEMERRTGLSLRTGTRDKEQPDRGIIIEDLSKSNVLPNALPHEGFELSIGTARIVVRGADARGCLYGVYALLERVQLVEGSWVIPCGTVRDWPDLPTRGICIEMLTPQRNDLELFKRYLRAFSFARANLVVFYFYPQQIQKWSTGTSSNEWGVAHIREIADYARSLGMEVWGGMVSRFDAGAFPLLPVAEAANIYDPREERSYTVLFPLYDRIIAVINPTVMLIGHDEVKGLSLYAGNEPGDTARLFAADIKKLRDWLASRRVGTAMWGDMLLDDSRWANEVGDANSNNPVYNSGATHLAIDAIPRDVRILDWHYGPSPSQKYSSIDYFRKHGFPVYGSSCNDPKATKALAKSVNEYHGQGIIGTDWGFWRTLSPAATTMFSQICGWSAACDISQNDIPVLASYLRKDRRVPVQEQQLSIDLQHISNRSTWDEPAGPAKGIFGLGRLLDLRALASGHQVIGGVIFHLLPAEQGHRNNCIVVSGGRGKGMQGSRETTIPINDQVTRQIAFLHGAYVEEPQVNPRGLGEYIIEFRSGWRETISLVENVNITDVRSNEGLRFNSWTFTKFPDELLESVPGWRGASEIGLPLNLQVLVWQNPYPEDKIKSIRFRASDKQDNVQLALLGLTLLQ
jgi:hypothetical protein